MNEGIRVSFGLVDLMQLNLVHRRLERITEERFLVPSEELEGLVSILDATLGDAQEVRRMIHSMRRRNDAG